MDSKDVKLLTELQRDSSQGIKELAKKLALPMSTVHARMKKYKKEGTIKAYRAILDDKKIGNYITAYVMLSVSPVEKGETEKTISEKIAGTPFVQEVQLVQGVYDIIVKLKIKDLHKLSDFTTGYLRKLNGIKDIDVFISLETIKEITEVEI